MTKNIAALAAQSEPYLAAVAQAVESLRAGEDVAVLSPARKRLGMLRGAAELMNLPAAASATQELENALAGAMSSGRPDAIPMVEQALLGLRKSLESPAADPVRAQRQLSDEYIDIFRDEAARLLRIVVTNTDRAMEDPAPNPHLETARRALHTLKGAAGVIGLREASGLAHELEDVLGEAAGELPSSAGSPAVDLMPGACQARLRPLVNSLAKACGLPEGQFNERISAPGLDAAVDTSTVRVPRDFLDELAKLSSEIATQAHSDPARTARASAALAECVGRIRRAPFASLSSRLRFVVRATAEKLGKDAELEVCGEAVELDRGLIEALTAPLEHLLRNAVAHGLETRADRIALGKPIHGRIEVRVALFDGMVRIEVADDGPGMNPERLRRTAVSRGILAPQGAAKLSHSAALRLAFAEGLSTAERIGETHGRGLGLSAVKESVDALRGQIHVESRPGFGTAFQILIPAEAPRSRARRIIDLTVGSASYAIPAGVVTRVVRVGQCAVEWRGGQALLRPSQGEAIPLVRFDEALRPVALGDADERSPVIILQSGMRRFAWVLDRLNGMRECAVLSLPEVLGEIEEFSGLAMPETDEPVLVLNPAVLFDRAEMASEPGSGRLEIQPANKAS